MKKITILFLSAIFVLTSVNAQHRGGSLYPLPGLYMMNVSPDGHYVTGYEPFGDGSLLWTKNDGVTLLNPGDASNAYAVSNTGVVVGRFYNLAMLDEYGYPFFTGGYFQNNQWNMLPLRPDFPNPPSSEYANLAEGISADGTMIGGVRTLPNTMMEPVIWINEVATVLEFEAVGQGARIQGLSADGTVACGWAAPTGGRQPVAWVNGQMIQIKQNGIWGGGEAVHTSPNGKYVGLQYDGKAAVYDVELDELTIVASSGFTNAVSDDGIAVGYTGMFPWDRSGFIYHPQLGLMNLRDYLVSAGVAEAATFSFDTPMALSADGLVMCGFGFGTGGWVVELDQHLKALYPPKNLTVTESGFRSLALTWSAPDPDPENTFIGYNIYRNNEKINSTMVTVTSYSDDALANGSYTYFIKAVWNDDEESVASNLGTMNVGELAIPFMEDFATGSYNDNYWNTSPGAGARWVISSWNGINAPCISYNPPAGGTYQEYFVSPYLDATNEEQVFLSFNIAPAQSWDGGTDDFLKVEAFNGTTWETVHTFSLITEYPSFTYHQFDISNIVANKQTRIRFTGYAENSTESFLMWNIDNISVFTPESALALSVPQRVTAHASNDGTVHVNWADPGQVAALAYTEKSEYLADIIGNEGVPFIGAIKFEAEDLIGYQDYQIVSITAYINNSSLFFSPNLRLAVFQGTNRIVDQAISYTNNTWNTFVLNTPITITADMTEPLYFGIEVVIHTMWDYPLGLCYGYDTNYELPFGGRGDIFSEDGGQTWQLLSDWDLYGVFAIRADIIRNETAQPKERLLGYKIFREGVNLLGLDWTGSSYLTNLNNFTDLHPLSNPNACYQVVAYYDVQQGSEEVQFCLNNPIACTVNVTANPTTGGSVTGAGTYIFNEPVTVTAIPNSGYHFVSWSIDGVLASDEAEYTFPAIHNVTVVANFAENNIIYNIFDSNIFMQSISPNGKYAVGYIPNMGSILWTEAGGFVNLTNPMDGSEARAVANNGIIAGQAYDMSILNGTLKTGGYYENSEWHVFPLNPDLPDPGSLGGNASNMTEAISADGSMLGGYMPISASMLKPTVWTNSVPAVLDFENVGSGARVTGMSADGTVIAGFDAPNYAQQPVVWINGVKRLITQDGVWGQGRCYKVSPNGKYVALEYNTLPAIYDVESDQLTIIGIPEGTMRGYANAVSDDGVVVGNIQTGLPPQMPANQQAFIYREQIGRMPLHNYLAAVGIPEVELGDLNYATAISADGLRIAGYGLLRAWVVIIESHIEIYQINVTANPPDGGTVTGGGIYEHGETVTINATPNVAYNFINWTEGNAQVTTNPQYQFTISGNRDFVANFQKKTYTIIATANANGTISPSGAVTVEHGSTPSFTITPNTGYHISAIYVDNVDIQYTVDIESSTSYTYTFDPVESNHTIVVTFARNCYAMNPGNITNGATITMNPAGCVQHGYPVTFTFTPHCVEITNVKIDGISQGAITSYTMTATGPLPLIEVETQAVQYTITATPAPGIDPLGHIELAGTHTYSCGADVPFELVPATMGIRVKTLLVDGVSVPVPVTYQYVFHNLSGSHTIHAEFEEYPQYIIQFGPNAAQNAGGAVFPTERPDMEYFIVVDSAANIQFSIVPDVGFEIEKVLVDNVNFGAIATYTFTELRANHTIFATFKPVMFTINATASANGAINPSGAVQVPQGADKMFTTLPDVGAELIALTVDGVNVGAPTTYTFTNVQNNHTIFAQFAKIQYPITAVAGANGSITPAGTIMVDHGDNKTFTFTPIFGYKVNEVLIDGVNNPAAVLAGYYTFINVTEPHTINVTFTKQIFNIVYTTSGNGNFSINNVITPAGTLEVAYDEHSPTLVFVPDEGYIVKQVLVDGENNYQAIVQGEYRFLNVAANHHIYVMFAPATFTIAATATSGGSINPSGTVVVPTGTDKKFTFSANAGNKLIRVLVDNIEDPTALANGEYTFTEVEANHTIAAQFEKQLYDVTFVCDAGSYATPVNGSVSPVEYGANFMFVVDVEAPYSQSKIMVRANGMLINPVSGVYTIKNITIDQEVTVTNITSNQYKITSKTGNYGGIIDPAGITVVNYGDDMTYDIIPSAGYKIDYLVINGVTQNPENTYTFSDIKADATIVAYFKYNIGIGENPESLITVYSYEKMVTILNKNLIPVQQIDIMDMYGRLVWKGQATADRTDIPLNVATGIYTVRIITTDNQVITTKVSIN